MIDSIELDKNLVFWCDACHCCHYTDSRWKVQRTGDLITIRPSIKVEYKDNKVCHFTVTNSIITYCNDSTHGLRGKTAKLKQI